MIQNLKGTTYIFILFLPPVKPKKKSIYIQTLSGFKVQKKKKKITPTTKFLPLISKTKKNISENFINQREKKLKN